MHLANHRNRTIVELKYYCKLSNLICFRNNRNRTIVELKFNPARGNRQKHRIVIVP